MSVVMKWQVDKARHWAFCDWYGQCKCWEVSAFEYANITEDEWVKIRDMHFDDLL